MLQSSFRQGRCKSNVYLITITPTANCKAKLCKNPGHFVFVQLKNRGNKARLCLICFPSCILIDTPFRGSLRGRLTPHGFTRCGKPRTSGDPDSHWIFRYSCQHSHSWYLQNAFAFSSTAYRPVCYPCLKCFVPQNLIKTSRRFGRLLYLVTFISTRVLYQWAVTLSLANDCF